MATEKERYEALINAGVATEDDKKEYAKIVATEATAEAPAEPAPAPAPQASGVAFEDSVDTDAFAKGGQQYYMPSEEGFFKSKLVESVKPSFTDKEQRWFVFETNDPKLKAQGRGVIVAEMGKGAFKLKDVLDGLAIPYRVENGMVKYSLSLPMGCYADWSKDAKGLGGVRISGLRTLEAGATVEKAI